MAKRNMVRYVKTCPIDGTQFEVGGRGRPKRSAVYCSIECVNAHRQSLNPHKGSKAFRPKKNRDTLHNEEWLRGKYETELLSTYDIGRMLDCAVPSVLHALRKFDITVRKGTEAKAGRTIRAFVPGGITSGDRVRERSYYEQISLKSEMVAAYGGACACCGELEITFLSLDHSNGDGLKDRKTNGGSTGVWRKLKREGWPKDGYRILCMNCNQATRFGRTCPHQTVAIPEKTAA